MPKKSPETPLYVKLPNAAVEKLDRAAEEGGLAKKDIVASLVTRFLGPNDGKLVMGTYAFQPYDPPEILNAEQAGQFLQLEERVVIELAEAGQLPGRKLGPVWRFSRDALVAWLAAPEKR